MRVNPKEFKRIPLRAHSLLSEVPLHDVWAIDLRGGGPGRTIVDLRALLSEAKLRAANPALNLFFGLRWWLGRVFGWDREPAQASEQSFLLRLSPSDQEASLVPPGTPEGPFRVLFVSPQESISEIQNSTVHGFSVFALIERSFGYRLYWGIYVRPVGRITAWYMRLIDPFRRVIIYPALLRYIKGAWSQGRADYRRAKSERAAVRKLRMSNLERHLDDLRRIPGGTDARQSKAERAAGVIRRAGGYRWVGLYDVGLAEISVIAWRGPTAPTHPRFPHSKGLNGAAVASGSPVVVQDVSTDPRYLTTIADTRAEMIMPIKGDDGHVVGTIDVESEQINAFSEADTAFLEKCAHILKPLWS